MKARITPSVLRTKADIRHFQKDAAEVRACSVLLFCVARSSLGTIHMDLCAKKICAERQDASQMYQVTWECDGSQAEQAKAHAAWQNSCGIGCRVPLLLLKT